MQPSNPTKMLYPGLAAKFKELMDAAGFSNSELAKRVWGTMLDKRKYQVARNRDRVGHYLNGTGYPNPTNLRKIADVFGVQVRDLRFPGDHIPQNQRRSRSRPSRPQSTPADSRKVLV